MKKEKKAKGKGEWKAKGKAILGIAMTAIMVASVMVAMIGSTGAYSVGGEYNIINNDGGATVQAVIIGQDVSFPESEEWTLGGVTIYRVHEGAVQWTKKVPDSNILTIAGDAWTKEGAFYVNYEDTSTYDAQLSFDDADMPLTLKVGTKEVSSIAPGTNLKIDTGGMNLFPQDRIDLVIIGPKGQIKYDETNDQKFTNISVTQLKKWYSGYPNRLATKGWTIGTYTFQVKTKSANACELDAASAVKDLEIIYIIYVPDNYSTIQAAVDAANDGDTIIVRDGTYTENVDVDKRLTIKSENGSANCIVQAANPGDHVFEVTADYVNISGFTVKEAREGHPYYSSGVYLCSANRCNVSNNNISDNSFGINLKYSNNNLLTRNNVLNTSSHGIISHLSSNNTLTNNFVSNTCDDGFYLVESCNNILSNNIVSNSSIHLYALSNNNTLTNNNVLYGHGIQLGDSGNNTIANNNISNNGYGISLADIGSNNNTIINNNISNNGCDIYLYYSSNNIIYLNNFINNTYNVHSYRSTNTWNSTEKITYTYKGKTYTNYLGNHWSDYNGSDADGDGIGVTPYSIDGDKDNYPLIERWENYLLELSGRLTIAGSTTVLPVNQECARILLDKNPELRISVSGGGSGHGIKAVGAGEVHIGAASRDIKSKEKEIYPDLTPAVIGGDSVAIVLHPNNPVEDLTFEQVSKIFAGEIKNWKEVGGGDEVIRVITRETGSGTREVFAKYVMEPFEQEITGEASVKPSNGEVRATVSADERSIGYLSLGYVDPSVKALKIDGVEATVENVLSGYYPIFRKLYLITKGEPSELEKAFIDFVLSDEGQEVVKDMGFIRVALIPQEEKIFDTKAPANPYPSIMGIHTGTITPNVTIKVSKLYTYPCEGTGGHTEYARIWNSSLDVNATWNGYTGDWHNLSFNECFTLQANEEYNYTIRTGSYPQIIREPGKGVIGGVINCTEFTDANGRRYNNWIPAIRLHE